MNYSEVDRNRRVPPKTVVLEPDAFCSKWGDRPASAVAVGLQNLSDDDETTARSEAEKIANRLKHEDPGNWVDAFNDALMWNLVARAVCDPNDVSKPCENLRMPEDYLKDALTPAGIRYLWDELEKLKVESSPLHPEATDTEIGALVELLSTDDPFAALDPIAAGRARRFLLFVLDELHGEVTPDEDPEPDDD